MGGESERRDNWGKLVRTRMDQETNSNAITLMNLRVHFNSNRETFPRQDHVKRPIS